MPNDVLFMQTADAFNYKEMLDLTSRTVTEFCRRHGHRYESFVGIRRGAFPWQATFNRICMMQDLLDSGFSGWLVYMDADAYIYDLDFDLNGYLDSHSDRSLIVNRVNDVPWDVNAGVMLMNFSHEHTHEVIRKWNSRFMALADDELARMPDWPYDYNDQTMLQDILHRNEHIRDSIHYESPEILNHAYARFIRQLLRAYYPSLPVRVQALKVAVAEIIRDENDNIIDQIYPVAMSALYRVLLGRDPEDGALDHYRGRFLQRGFESAFRDTFVEFLASQEYRDRMGG